MNAPPPLHDRRRLLARRMSLHIQLRIAAAAVLALATLFGRFGLGLEGLPVRGLLGLAVLILAYNWVILIVARSRRFGLDRLLFHAAWIDFFALAVTLWFTGGSRSPFLPFFLLHLVVSSMMLSREASIALGVIASLIILALIGLDVSGAAPAHALPGDLAPAGPQSWRAALTLAAVYLGAILGTLLLFTSLGAELRSREERLARQADELERLADTRRDFLRVTTHNLRSPIGAARMFLSNLDADLAEPLQPKQREWIRRAERRLAGLSEFLTEMTRFAALEAGQLEAEKRPIDIAELLHRLARQYGDAAVEKKLTVTVDVPEGLCQPRAMPTLLGEAVANFVTNAIKFSPEGGTVKLCAAREGSGVRIDVLDEGPGIPTDSLERIFEDFVRLEGTKSAGGTGLGLAITKRIAEAHGGWVRAETRPEGGARLSLWIPSTT